MYYLVINQVILHWPGSENSCNGLKLISEDKDSGQKTCDLVNTISLDS